MIALGFHSPSMALWALLALPIVALYFLKLKRPLLRVPSLVLWQQVLQDQRVNSPFQRFRRNLLLWLQLTLLALLVLALMQPYFRGVDAAARTLLLLDRSASMGARDAPGGPTRLEVAKSRIEAMVAGLAGGQRIGLIAFGDTPRQVVPFTDSPRLLLDGLASVSCEEVASEVDGALRMAEALSRTRPIDQVVLLTDGNLPAEVDFDLPFALRFERIPSGGANVGITAAHARRAGKDGWAVFAQVEGSPATDVPCQLLLLQDGEERFREAVHLRQGSGQRFMFPLRATQRTEVELRLVADGFDALPADDRAWLVLSAGRSLRVGIAAGLEVFARAFAAFEDVEIVSPGGAGPPADLLLTGDDPGAGAGSPTSLFVGRIPAVLEPLLTRSVLTSGTSRIIDWERVHPLLEHVDLREVELGEEIAWREGQDVTQLEGRRFDVLVEGRRGPLLLRRDDGEFIEFHMLFDPRRSTLPFRVGFPIFCRNLTLIAMQRAGLLEVPAPRTGVLPEWRGIADTVYTITSPDGTTQRLTADESRLLRGISAPLAGRYRIAGPAGAEELVGVSLLAADETRLGAIESLKMRELAVTARQDVLPSDQVLWPWLVWFGLAVLLLEWWYSQARPGGPRRQELRRVA